MKHDLHATAYSFNLTPTHSGRARGRWQLVSLLLGALLLLGGQGQAQVILKVGTSAGATYPTITLALAAVPSPLTQAYELELWDAAYTENVLLNKTGTPTRTLTIRPKAGVSPVITGTVTFGAGSRYATLDGNNGAPRALTVQQPSIALPAVVFSGDASENKVSEAKILGSNTSLTSGVVVVGDGVSTGNDRNTVTKSFVGNAFIAQLPANLVYAASATGTNDNFTLSDCELFNFTNTGVLVAAGNGNDWTISGNSFYYNAFTLPSTAQTAIDFRPGPAANDALVSGNFIGGQAAGATGGAWVNNGILDFRGIVISCGSSTTDINQVTNNTVSQISLTGTGPEALTALSVEGGRVELTGNILTNLTNTGPSANGVNVLISKGVTILDSFLVGNGQLMLVYGGTTQVLGDFTNAGVLTLSGGNIRVDGNFINSGTLAQTDGVLEIKGDMLGLGLFSSTTGLVKLTGASNQKVSGGLYFNLEVNGSGTKTLNRDASVINGVQMVAGFLSTGSHSIILGNAGTLFETDASYVLGEVEVERTPLVGGSESFGGVGLMLEPTLASLPPGPTLVKRFTGTPSVGVGGRQGIKRYFDINATVNTGLNVVMTISYFAHELNGIAPANLRFFKSVDNGVTWQNRGRSAAGEGFAVLNGVNSFSRWTLGDVAAPLPVTLTAFRAERQGRNALLTWATATETNNRGFGLEVSLDGKAYREIGFVPAEGNSTTPRSYRFVDAAAGKTGPRYYRLRQDDREGPSQFSAPQLLNFDALPAAFAAYPTRFGADLTLALAHPTATTATLRLLDALGREVWRQEQPVTGGAPLHVQPACAAGSYVLTATMDGQVFRQRVVKD
ncbi:hypothetical protein [Hymenobacter sp.]|uniref:hypothetical protein n=1 Tax=Hymenobacter sp. TaxID=1898978 RepID=UPI00286CEA45|nr:hypothetical protein [Hymenobacter sp.]